MTDLPKPLMEIEEKKLRARERVLQAVREGMSYSERIEAASRLQEQGEQLDLILKLFPEFRDVNTFSWPLSKGVSVEVRFRGDTVNSKHIETLRQYLELAKNVIEADDEGGEGD